MALILPAMKSSRDAARRIRCSNQMKQIALAMHNYHSSRSTFPPDRVVDANGKPMHSWRVLVLPYLGEQALYQKYKLNEPWDGPNNRKLAAAMPEIYRCPSHTEDSSQAASETNYFAVVGPEAVFLSAGTTRSLRSITDGTSKTVMIIEASGLGVNWMEPRDLSLDEAMQLLTNRPRSGHLNVHDGFLTTTYYETSERFVAYCDGSVHWVGQLRDVDVAKALLTAAGGERLPADWAENFVPTVKTTFVKWGKVWGLCVLVLLSLLPARWTKRCAVSPNEGEEHSATGGWGNAPETLGAAGALPQAPAADAPAST
jgi:hypothetical protein